MPKNYRKYSVKYRLYAYFNKYKLQKKVCACQVLSISSLIFTIISALSCTSPPAIDPFVFRNDGIQIDLKADNMLNSYDGKAHTIRLALYQLSNNAAFKELSSNSNGINELLKVRKFDPSVVSYEQIIVKPNDSRLIIMDRAAQAKWIGIAAGYYNSQGNIPPVKLIEIPSAAKRKTLIRRFGEFTGLLTPYEKRHVPALFIQLVFTPVTMYETSVFQ